MSMIQVPVTVRQDATGRFVARPAPVPDEAEGDTPEEAVAKLQAETTPLGVKPPARLEPIPVSEHPNPWAALAASFKDDPAVDEWLKVMADLREREGPIPELTCQEPL